MNRSELFADFLSLETPLLTPANPFRTCDWADSHDQVAFLESFEAPSAGGGKVLVDVYYNRSLADIDQATGTSLWVNDPELNPFDYTVLYRKYCDFDHQGILDRLKSRFYELKFFYLRTGEPVEQD